MTKQRLLEIAKNYFPSEDSEKSLTFNDINPNHFEFQDKINNYIDNYIDHFDDNECCQITDLITDYCTVALRIALSWFGSSDKLKNFYIDDCGIIEYVDDYLTINKLSDYYDKFDVMTTALSVIDDLEAH